MNARVTALLAVAIVGLALEGCAQYRLVRPDDDPIGQSRRQTISAFFWGTMYSPQVIAADCEGLGYNDVTIHNNFGYALISVLTLGIWMPMDVEYRCAAPPPVIEEFSDIDTPEDEPDE